MQGEMSHSLPAAVVAADTTTLAGATVALAAAAFASAAGL